jgi:hypothetical protein
VYQTYHKCYEHATYSCPKEERQIWVPRKNDKQKEEVIKPKETVIEMNNHIGFGKIIRKPEKQRNSSGEG